MRFFGSLALAALLCGTLFSSPAGAQYSGVIERRLTLDSPALGRPLLFSVYRPAAEPADGSRWPVLYLLEGRPGETDWLDQGFVYEVIDKAIADGVIPPTLVVMPAAPFSWYVDNPDTGGAGSVATAISHDLVAAIDELYPTASCREARAVGGLSMGGYGAALFGLERPDQYVAAMSFSGAIAPPMAATDDERVRRSDEYYDGAYGRPLDRDRFNALTIFSKLKAAKDIEGPKPAMFLAAGDRDRGGLLMSLTLVHVELLRGGYDATLRINPGQHDWPTWRDHLTQALTWLGPRIDPSCGQAVALGDIGRRSDP